MGARHNGRELNMEDEHQHEQLPDDAPLVRRFFEDQNRYWIALDEMQCPLCDCDSWSAGNRPNFVAEIFFAPTHATYCSHINDDGTPCLCLATPMPERNGKPRPIRELDADKADLCPHHGNRDELQDALQDIGDKRWLMHHIVTGEKETFTKRKKD